MSRATSRRFAVGVVAALVVSTLLSRRASASDDDEHDDNNFRPDVIECEDALSRLQSCCPGFDATPVLCNFLFDRSSGCGSTTTNSVEPAFTRKESACIRDTSCDALVVGKVCERAQAARAYSKNTTVSTSSSSSSSGSSGADNWGSSSSSSGSNKTVTHKPVCP
jgi:hypothetical protein